MKRDPDPDREDALLDALLGDENWDAASAVLKGRALKAFHARQRRRRLTRYGGSLVILAGVVAIGSHWIGDPESAPEQASVTPAEVPTEPEEVGYLTDEELLSFFPEGSCVVAEIDGQKELVFLDRDNDFMSR